MINDERFQKISEVQARYADHLLSLPHVVGVGVGFRKVGGEMTDTLALVVMVDEKVPVAQLAAEEVIPSALDDVPVDVQSMGGAFTPL